MPRLWTDDHGEPGLRRKFDVYRPRDEFQAWKVAGESRYPHAARLGADGEFVFVLRPETDEDAYYALRDYADGVKLRDTQLAADICEQLDRIWAANTPYARCGLAGVWPASGASTPVA